MPVPALALSLLHGALPAGVAGAALVAALLPASSRRLPRLARPLLLDFVDEDDLAEARAVERQSIAAALRQHGLTEATEIEEQHRLLHDGLADEQAPLLGDGVRAEPRLRASRSVTAGLAVIAAAELAWTAARLDYAGASAFSWLYVLFRTLRSPPVTPPWATLLIGLCHLVAALLVLLDAVLLRQPLLVPVLTGLPALVLVLLAASLPLSPYPAPPLAPGVPPPAREDYATLLEWVTFSWLTPLINEGFKRDLDDGDVFALSASSRSALILRKMEALSGTLLQRLWIANAHDVFADATLTFVSAALSVSGPFFLKRILEAITQAASSPTGKVPSSAYLLPLAAFTASVLKAQTDLQHLYHGRRACIRTRGELISLIYNKALRTRANQQAGEAETAAPGAPKKPAAGARDLGAIVSLMAVDAQKISVLLAGAYFLYSSPIEILVAGVFLYNLLGWSALAGFSVLLISTPLQSLLTRRSMRITRELGAARDRRTGLIAEMFSALRPIRYFAQEEQFKARIIEAREHELSLLRKRQRLSALNSVLWGATPACITSLSFLAYTLSGHRLTISVAFPAIAVITSMRNALSVLPMYINNILNARVSLERIEDYLRSDEVPAWVSTLAASDSKIVTDGRLGFESATFRWPAVSAVADVPVAAVEKSSFAARLAAKLRLRSKPAPETPKVAVTATTSGTATPAEPFSLRDLSVIFPQGKLSLVVGPTASGKSSLLSALLGEMIMEDDGAVYLPKTRDRLVSFCAQRPWLQNATIRNNILFGSPFEATRYEQTLVACCLAPDLAILPGGDAAEIGEGGLTLSGGQRARVALARAVYAPSQTVLLDDVLSALDATTGKRIVEDLLAGPLLKDRTVVLVTHHVDLALTIPCAHVVKLSRGHIEAQGSPDELRASGHLAPAVRDSATDSEKENTPADATAAPPKIAASTDAGQLVSKERRSTGGTKLKVYVSYLRAFGYATLAFAFSAMLLRQSTDVGEKFYLSWWGTASARSLLLPFIELPALGALHHAVHIAHEGALSAMRGDEAPLLYLLGFVGLQAVGFLLMLCVILIMQGGGRRAARRIFGQALGSLMSATSRWLDQTPRGRVLNTMSKDVSQVDESCTDTLQAMSVYILGLFTSLVVVTLTLPTMLLPVAFLALINWQVARRYVATARSFRRIESTSRSPIFARFSELLSGLETVRAFAAERRLLAEFLVNLDQMSSSFALFWFSSRWALVRLDVLGAVGTATASVAALNGGIPAGLAGVALTSLQTVVGAVYWLSRFQSTLDQDLNSIERLQDLISPERTKQEPAAITGCRPPASWPARGEIKFENLTLRYAPDLEPALRNVSFTVRPGEKLGIVGRTGSGKSTLALALFRFVEFDAGSISIDGISIADLGLRDLRSRLSIIPQDPTLFSGTVRSNIDPFDEHPDEELLEALHRVHLRTPPSQSQIASRVSSAPASLQGDDDERSTVSLDTVILEGGTNLSAGQRQLIAMARALLRAGRVIIMDEASSATDFDTDTAIQRAISEGFKDSTVLTIAHRLSTVAVCDRILVLAAGEIVEFDTPATLLEREDGHFRTLCEQSGELEHLRQLAART